MSKIKHIFHRLGAEYKAMHKPSGRELVIWTSKIAGCACIAAVALKIVDTGFAALLGLIL